MHAHREVGGDGGRSHACAPVGDMQRGDAAVERESLAMSFARRVDAVGAGLVAHSEVARAYVAGEEGGRRGRRYVLIGQRRRAWGVAWALDPGKYVNARWTALWFHCDPEANLQGMCRPLPLDPGFVLHGVGVELDAEAPRELRHVLLVTALRRACCRHERRVGTS